MQENIKLKVIEIEANKLEPGAKYIFCIDPDLPGHFSEYIYEELSRLLGYEKFTLLGLNKDQLNIYSIKPENAEEGTTPDVQATV